MTRSRFMVLVLAVLLLGGFIGLALAQKPVTKCGPDHAILYKRAVKLLDSAEKKLSGGYTAEAKAQVKEANSLFTILQKECGPEQKDRVLTDKEAQQEAINQKLCADESAQAERLEKSAKEKGQKALKIEATNSDLYQKYMLEVKTENEQAQKRYIRAEIYALRNQQMLFKFLIR